MPSPVHDTLGLPSSYFYALIPSAVCQLSLESTDAVFSQDCMHSRAVGLLQVWAVVGRARHLPVAELQDILQHSHFDSSVLTT